MRFGPICALADPFPFPQPGGLKIEGEDDAYDFGTGDGFDVDATKEPWLKGEKGYSYE